MSQGNVQLNQFRRAQAVAALLALGSPLFSVPAYAATTITGTPAAQPAAPVKIATCLANIDGSALTPDITFASGGSGAVVSSVVKYTYFGAGNAQLGTAEFSPPYAATSFPSGAASFTCSIVRENLADGTTFAASVGPQTNAVPYIAGGVGAAALIALLASHGGSSTSPVSTPTITPTQVPTQGPTQTPTSPPTQAPTATPTSAPTSVLTMAPTLAPTPTPSASPSSTASSSASPSASPSSSASASASPSASPSSSASPSASPSASASASASPSASPSPIATPTSGPLKISPSTISFTSVPSPDPSQSAVVSETGYSGTISLASTQCSTGSGNTSGTVATITPSSGSAPLTVTVTAQGAGQCVYTFEDTTGNEVALTVNVTTTTVVVNKRKKNPEAPKPAPAPAPAPAPVRQTIEPNSPKPKDRDGG